MASGVFHHELRERKFGTLPQEYRIRSTALPFRLGHAGLSGGELRQKDASAMIWKEEPARGW